jgi:hypothetical protein
MKVVKSSERRRTIARMETINWLPVSENARSTIMARRTLREGSVMGRRGRKEG